MRITATTLILACMAATPILCQTEKDTEPATSKERELQACGTKDKEVNYVADTDKKSHPTGEAAADKALIYVLRTSMMGNKIQTKLAVDGEWKGVNRGHNYFFFTLPPGIHYFCDQAENRSILVLTVEAGKTYYLEQEIRMGVMKARTQLSVMDDAEGQKHLPSMHPSTWEVK